MVTVRDDSPLASGLAALYHLWDAIRPSEPSPFANTGNRLDTPKVSIHAYDWGNEDQPFNLRWMGENIRWYKYAGRGLTASREIDGDYLREFMADCVAAILDTSVKSRDG